MPQEQPVPQYLRVESASSLQFTGSMADIRRCAIAVLLDTIGHLSSGINVEAASTLVRFDGLAWEGEEVFNDFLLLGHDRDYMLVRLDGESGQLCQRLRFAARYDDEQYESDVSEDELHRLQKTAALERLTFAGP